MDINCPICNKKIFLFTQYKDIQNITDEKIYSAFECESCNILFQYPFWKPEETFKFYETTYYAHTENNQKLPRGIRILDFYLKNNFLSKLLPSFIRSKLFPYYQVILKSKTVLDIGCGKGLFLDLMKKHNKVTYGLEPSEQARAIASNKGHTMLEKSFFNLDKNDLKFDLITMFQVAEHLSVQEIFEDDFFSKIYDSLEVGGYLVIETPNFECNYAKEFKNNWRALELPRHLVIFTPESISKILADKGFLTTVYTRMSPIDIKASLNLKYPNKTLKNRLLKFLSFCKIVLSPKNNSSLLAAVSQKNN